jgi:hypothetical protein
VADITITADQVLPVSLGEIKDQEGNAADVQGIRWSTSDATIITFEPGEDDRHGTIVSHLVGEATVMVEADVDMGEGVVMRTGSRIITVTAGQAATLSLELGTPAPKEAPTPTPEPAPEPTPAPPPTA